MASNLLKKALDVIKSSGVEESFLKSAGLTSLDELSPDNFEDPYPTKPQVTTTATLSGARSVAKEQPKETVDGKERPAPTAASDILLGFIGLDVTYAPRRKLSFYTPSCLMMDRIVHLINYYLVDNFYFKRSAPDYHPYVVRLYYGVLFWIQCLRAMHDARALNADRHQFLVRFLDAFPTEGLPIAGPLVPLFKTLCTSQPEIPTYGKVCPTIPEPVGPHARRDFMAEDVDCHFLPNVPGIFALLEDLNSLINAATPIYPKKGKHIPVTHDATAAKVFGHHTFPIPAERTDAEKWALCSPGLQYPCEADARLNESFAERYEYFNFPTTMANDCLMEIEFFLSMNSSLDWFSQVRDVAATVAAYFEGSGTLADCSPHGINANQYSVCLTNTAAFAVAPTRVADPTSSVCYPFRLATSARNPPALTGPLAAMAQTHVVMHPLHPYFGSFGLKEGMGEFWDIRPIEYSVTDDSSYLSLNDGVRRMMKSKN